MELVVFLVYCAGAPFTFGIFHALDDEASFEMCATFAFFWPIVLPGFIFLAIGYWCVKLAQKITKIRIIR
jgi:hypothetical protein